ncbi:uncharacterized protein DNG_01571 [Cephalotrichum gorgonifer]|uniref:Uncharacterized protein n=1 Tax=Cephalotrichum gorgonifer TaxID=2041049 RepID=A0AAE8SRS7_9PEZI|nr:uncharacterized protein DNG_01571 [Cephalotrichum gorgonifer]
MGIPVLREAECPERRG